MCEKMTRKHLRMSVRGALWNREFTCFEDADGKQLNEREGFNFLCDELEAGHKFIPVCKREECPDFDFTGPGCPGHIVDFKGPEE